MLKFQQNDAIENLTCCPNDCGGRARGMCQNIGSISSRTSTRNTVRDNWPHYFTHVCRCTGNYWGYDCTRCKYGYYGEDCSQNQTRPRESIQQLTDQEWRDYIQILKWTRTYQSDYVVFLNEVEPGDYANIQNQTINLYDLFVWLHHYAAKDNENMGGKYVYVYIVLLVYRLPFLSFSGLCSRSHRIPNMAPTVHVMVGVGDPVHVKGNGRSKLPPIQTALLGLENGGTDERHEHG